jgi:threonine dehydratase
VALPVTADDVRRAHAAIEGAVVRTPTTYSKALSLVTGADVFVKFENLQYTGSFKERGARNQLASLSAKDCKRGVIASSAGNFAQAVAYHAGLLGIPARVVMPSATPPVKVARTEALGARVSLHGRSFDDAKKHAESLAVADGLTLLSPFDTPEVIAGEGTVAIEMLEDVPDLDTLVVPVGGGGLLSGMAVVARDMAPGVELVGVQSEAFPGMVAALRGDPLPVGGTTIAEGIAVKQPGAIARAILEALETDVVVVSEPRIEEAVCMYLEVEKVVAEGAGAAPLAALLQHGDRFAGRRVGLVLSGGNIDLTLLASVIIRGVVRSGRLAVLRVTLPDEPGALGRLTTIVGEHGANIIEVRHGRYALSMQLRLAQVELTVEASTAAQVDELVAAIDAAWYAVHVLPAA